MPYVSAKYAPPNATMPEPPGAPKQVIATDDQGTEWFLAENSLVGDWQRYLDAGGTIDPADPAAATDQNITSAPTNLTGGPTIAQVLGAP